MWYAYVLRSKKKGSWYIGSTKDLQKRITSHNARRNKATKHGAPWELLYYEAGHSRDDARAREKYLKSGMGRRFIKNRLKFFFAEDL